MKSTTEKNHQLLIFDWDGTLMNSVSRIVKCMQQMEDKLQLPRSTAAHIQQYIGLGLEVAIQQMHPQLNESMIIKATASYRSIYLGYSSASDLFGGAKAMIEALHPHYQLAIATGKGKLGLKKALEYHDLNSWFSALRTADQTRSKPDPLMLEELLIETGIPVEQALMIGDTTFDLDMAKAIGMDSLGVSYGVHSIEQLESSEPLAIVDSIAELHRWLAR